MTHTVTFPSPNTTGTTTTIEAETSIVIVGANGAGKTRLGSWIDMNSPHTKLVNRVAAQKSLTIPSSSSTSSLDMAENNLLYGTLQLDVDTYRHKINGKWGGKPNTYLQNDYDKLLTYLFTDEFDKSTKYRQKAKDAAQRDEPPETHLDIVMRIWESVLPHRRLVIGAGKIEVHPRTSEATTYNASEMSDGERVIFYLIGQCLATKPNGIIVIDEPELHLHRSLQSRLWDAIEAERPDCLFIYLTHDLDFASTRLNAVKIWIKSYDGRQWDWCKIPTNQEIPELLFLEILGGRKPVLFVEGDRGSLDYFLYSHLYPNYTIAPCKNASAVIHSTRSFATLRQLHDLECKGIIDRDYLSDEEVRHLRDLSIFCLDVGEIENVFLGEDVLRIVGTSLHMADEEINDAICRAKELVFSQMGNDRERITSAITAARIENAFQSFNAKALGQTGLAQSVTNLFSAIDVPALYADTQKEVNRIIDQNDYHAALTLYTNKGLLPQISSLFGFQSSALRDHIKRLISCKDNKEVINAIRKVVPELAS